MEKAMYVQELKAGKLSKIILLIGISLGYFMVLLDMTVVSVALPDIRTDLGGGLSGLQWVVNAYTIVFAGLMLSMGTIADRFGAKRIFLSGLVIFLAASAVSAASGSLGELVAWRAILGIGGAALLPASLTLIVHAFPDSAERARAMGIWAAVTGIAMAAGPVVGGVLVDSFGWRSIFLLNIPIAILSLIITSRFIAEAPRNPGRKLDLAGQTLAIGAIVFMSYGLMEGESERWGSGPIAAAFGLAALCVVLFVIVEFRVKSPLLPLRLFRNYTISAGLLAGMLINIGLSGSLFILPLFFQQLRGLSAHAAGLALLPMMIPMAFNPILTGRIVGRIGARMPMTAGFALAALGALLLLRLDVESGYAVTSIGLLLLGFGVSFTIPSLMAAVMGSAPKEQSGAVSGALNASRQLGATLGVAILGSIISGSGSFVAGMHVSLLVTTIILVCGSLLSFAFVGRKAVG
ncbi:MFS transporter [Paenibacillus sp. HB172176]|uniref:MFS transporter n=1 Tax=Paenibacillus sp. HB172176 TaxID=2493690 RepID=UPI001F109683|nr:MFS transporter [Paenibacillus sp. HB172176]